MLSRPDWLPNLYIRCRAETPLLGPEPLYVRTSSVSRPVGCSPVGPAPYIWCHLPHGRTGILPSLVTSSRTNSQVGEIVANYSVGCVSVRPSEVAGFRRLAAWIGCASVAVRHSGRAEAPSTGGRHPYTKRNALIRISISHRRNVTIGKNVHRRLKSDPEK
jgi:hypothetical protein